MSSDGLVSRSISGHRGRDRYLGVPYAEPRA